MNNAVALIRYVEVKYFTRKETISRMTSIQVSLSAQTSSFIFDVFITNLTSVLLFFILW